MRAGEVALHSGSGFVAPRLTLACAGVADPVRDPGDGREAARRSA